ncbi:MAG TPA: GYF domain-containing protein, partial [Microthrixaceae bacterium]|nr:GYF domain-containing protein [Microthrixaceae bacterium]
MSDLPPLDQPQAYVVVGPNDQRGPYTLDLLIGEVVAGRLHDATPVWWPGLAEWTTMNGQAAVAAEIARRRGVEVQAAPAPVAPAPEATPAPANPVASDPYAGYSAAPAAAPAVDPNPDQAAPIDPTPPAAQPVEPAAAQYGTTGYDAASYGAAEPAQADASQGYSYDPVAAVPVAADPLSPVVPEPEPEPQAPVAAAPVTSTPAGWTVTDTSTPVGALA